MSAYDRNGSLIRAWDPPLPINLTGADQPGANLTYKSLRASTLGRAGSLAPAIERTSSSVPILAKRWARITLTSEGPRFRGLNKDAVFAATEWATCIRDSIYSIYGAREPGGHASPSVDCTCGFYAVPADILPDWHYPKKFAVELLVQLSGRVIEHERGYRAQHQRVLEGRWPTCWACGVAPVQRVFFDLDSPSLVRWTDCGNHNINASDAVEVDTATLERALGVPFANGGSDDA